MSIDDCAVDAEAVRIDGKRPCLDDSCGSSDALSVYMNADDSCSAYCFSCGKSFQNLDPETYTLQHSHQSPLKKATKMIEGLITDSEIKPLTARKISDETCKKFNYRVGKYKGKPVQIAEYQIKGQVVAQHIRTANKDFYWLGNAKKVELFGQHLFKSEGGKRIIITEGEIDCLTISQLLGNKWPVVSIPSGAEGAKRSFKDNLEFLESYKEVVICFDNDEPGRLAADECAQILTAGKAKIVSLGNYKDANEMLQEGQTAQLMTALWEAKVYRPDGIISASEITLEYLMQEEANTAFEIPYPKLNQRLKGGLRKGELTLVTAGSGVGKSTWVRELSYYLWSHHKLRIAEVRLEESFKKSALGFMALMNNVPMGDLFLNKDTLTQEQWEASHAALIEGDRLQLYDHFGSLESDNLLAKLRYLAVGLDVDFIIVDHLSIIVSGKEDGDERRIIDNLMTQLRSLVESTGVGVIAVCHLKQPEGKPHEEGGRVTLSQLRGSGALKQLSDVIVGLERNQQSLTEPDVSELRLLKDRLFGDVGLADASKYHKDTGRMLPYDREEVDDEFSDDNSF